LGAPVNRLPPLLHAEHPIGRVIERDDTYEIRLKAKPVRHVALAFKGEALGCERIDQSHLTEGPDIVVNWSRAPKPVRVSFEATRGSDDASMLT
jgi:hypothetical protein